MSDAKTSSLQRMIETARSRRAAEESAFREQELQNIQPWAVRYFSQELADVLEWTTQWDAQERMPFLAFSVAGTDGSQHRFHLYALNLTPHPLADRFRGHIGLLVSQTNLQQETVVDDKDALLLALDHVLEL